MKLLFINCYIEESVVYEFPDPKILPFTDKKVFGLLKLHNIDIPLQSSSYHRSDDSIHGAISEIIINVTRNKLFFNTIIRSMVNINIERKLFSEFTHLVQM